MGPLIDERALQTVRADVALAHQEGTVLLDRTITGNGWFQGPGVATDIQPQRRLAQEEIFWPVAAVLRCHTFEEALNVAMQSDCALTGGIYFRSPSNIQRAREAFDVGNFSINRPIAGRTTTFRKPPPVGGSTKARGDGYLSQCMVQRVTSEYTMRRGFALTQ